MVEQMVARKAVPTMAVGSLDCWAARMAMAVVVVVVQGEEEEQYYILRMSSFLQVHIL